MVVHSLNNTGLTPQAINSIQKTLSSFPEVEEAILYGSRAKGNYRIGSDIDLCLKGKNLTTQTLLALDGKLDDLMLPYTFDLCIYDKIDNQNLVGHIDRVGVVFYRSKLAP